MKIITKIMFVELIQNQTMNGTKIKCLTQQQIRYYKAVKNLIFKNEISSPFWPINRLYDPKWPWYQYVVQAHWRLLEFLSRKSTFFKFDVLKDSPCCCDDFHTKLLVVGGHLRRRNRKNAIHHICFVTSSITSALWVIHHLKALDLNCVFRLFFRFRLRKWPPTIKSLV